MESDEELVIIALLLDEENEEERRENIKCGYMIYSKKGHNLENIIHCLLICSTTM